VPTTGFKTNVWRPLARTRPDFDGTFRLWIPRHPQVEGQRVLHSPFITGKPRLTCRNSGKAGHLE